MGGVGASSSVAAAASGTMSNSAANFIPCVLILLPAGRPLPTALLARGHAADAGEWEMERHEVHVSGYGAVQQRAASVGRLLGSQVEAVLPIRPLQVQGMNGRVAHVEEM